MSYTVPSTNDHITALNGSATTTDAAGNMTSKPSLSLTFDDWSRLRTATTGGVTTTYGVNGLHERVSKTDGVNSRVYVYSAPGHLLGVYNGATGAVVEEIAYLGARPVADVRSGTIYPIETDHLRTPLRVLDGSNNTVWSWKDREPFGASAPVEGTVGGSPFVFNLRFPGQWADAESGLVSNGYRDYDPMLGRYVESDPLGLAAGMNVYGYVGGDPLGASDPFGLARLGTRPLDGIYIVPRFGIAITEAMKITDTRMLHEAFWYDDIPSENIGFYGVNGAINKPGFLGADPRWPT